MTRLFRIVILGVLACAGSADALAQARPRRLPDHRPEMRLGLAEADSLLGVGSTEQAVALLRERLELYADDPVYGWQLQERLGVALVRAGQAREALPLLEETVRHGPERWQGHRNLAAALMDLGRRGRALSEFRQAVDLAPREFEIRLEFGQVLLGYRNHAEAAIHLEEARRLCGDCARVLPALARLYVQSGRPAEAVPILDVLHAEAPGPESRRNLVEALQQAGDDARLVSLLGDSPLPDLAADEILLLLEAEGRLEVAVHSERMLDWLRGPEPAGEAVAQLQQHAGFWGRLCLNLLQAGRDGEALRAADRAVELDPRNVVYRNNRVVLLTRLERHDEARREWNKVLELDPTLEERNKR